MRKSVSVGANVSLIPKPISPKSFTTWVYYEFFGEDDDDSKRTIIDMAISLDFHSATEDDFHEFSVKYMGKSKKMAFMNFLLWGFSWESVLQAIALRESIKSTLKLDNWQGHHLPRQLRPF